MANLNFTMKRYNGSSYDTLYPKNTLNQTLINNDSLVNRLALSGTNLTGIDALNAVVPLDKKIWWKRTVNFIESQGDEREVVVYNDLQENDAVTITYGDAISVNAETGVVSLSGTTSTTHSFSYSSPSNVLEVRGHYFQYAGSNSIYFAESTATYRKFIYSVTSASTTTYYYRVAVTAKSVSGVESYGAWTSEWSDNPNAYTEGISNGYEYRYMPDYLTFTRMAPKIQTGIYYGTGDTITLNFNFAPSLVLITDETSYTGDRDCYTFINRETYGHTLLLTDSAMVRKAVKYTYIAIG